MTDKIANSIAAHQQAINELKEIKEHVVESLNKKVRFRIETKRLFHAWEPYTIKSTDKLEISAIAMCSIIKIKKCSNFGTTQ